jgi:hypothetical protein
MGEDYQVIARRWRPRRFSALVGQEAIVKTVENAIRLNSSLEVGSTVDQQCQQKSNFLST